MSELEAIREQVFEYARLEAFIQNTALEWLIQYKRYKHIPDFVFCRVMPLFTFINYMPESYKFNPKEIEQRIEDLFNQLKSECDL